MRLRRIYDSTIQGGEAVDTWLGRCLSPCGERRAQITNFLFHIIWTFDSLRDFLVNEPAITAPQIVELLFYRWLCYSQSRSKILV
jgi:hypothetical protein